MATKDQISTLAGAIVSRQASFGQLSKDDRQWVIQNPEKAIGLFVKAVNNRAGLGCENIPSLPRRLTVWKTILVGGITQRALRKEVCRYHNVSEEAQYMMRKINMKISTTSETINLVKLSLKDLGFVENGIFSDVVGVASSDEFLQDEFLTEWSKKNLDGQVIKLVQPECGMHLRLQYKDQPCSEVIVMGMKECINQDGYPDVFRISRNASSDPGWLSGYYASSTERNLDDWGRFIGSELRWDMRDQIVFKLV